MSFGVEQNFKTLFVLKITPSQFQLHSNSSNTSLPRLLATYCGYITDDQNNGILQIKNYAMSILNSYLLRHCL